MVNYGHLIENRAKVIKQENFYNFETIFGKAKKLKIEPGLGHGSQSLPKLLTPVYRSRKRLASPLDPRA